MFWWQHVNLHLLLMKYLLQKASGFVLGEKPFLKFQYMNFSLSIDQRYKKNLQIWAK